MDYICEPILLNRDFPFAVYDGRGFSRDDEAAGHIWMHSHHCLEINLCTEGDGLYTIGQDDYPINRDDIFIINNLEYHAARNLSGTMRLMVIVFDPQLILQGSSDYGYIRAFYEWKRAFKHRIPAADIQYAGIKAVFEAIRLEYSRKQQGWELVVKAQLLMLLAVLYRSFMSTDGLGSEIQSFQEDYNRIAPALRYMEEHFSRDIRLDELARAASMSSHYFSSFFSRTMNTTVIGYLQSVRLKAACIRLVTTTEPILSIAFESGFGTISYFNRAFRKKYGITPGEYRRLNNSALTKN